VRHGHSEKNELRIFSSWPEKKQHHLTEQGKKEIQRVAVKLKRKKIDFIVSSDLTRAKETAAILSKEFGVKIVYDKRVRETDSGKLNGKKTEELARVWGKPGEPEMEHYLRRFIDPLPGGENWANVQRRMYGVVENLEKRYKDKTILLVSHELPLTLLETTLKGLSRQETAVFRKNKAIATGELRSVSFVKLPYNQEMEVDLHRPYIDDIFFPCAKCNFPCAKCKGTMSRVKDVVDVWYDSGAMPFAQNHWMGEKNPKEFPADYIVEAIDQTRGWFYTLLAVSTLLGYGPPYRNVISLGHVLDEKGEKMSKSKGNVVSPWDMAEKYGMDAARWYFFSANHPWDPKLFAEKDLQQTLRKFLLTLWNSLVFYETYNPKRDLRSAKSPLGKNVLDQWIVSRLNTTAAAMTKNMDAYDITGAARVLESFVIDDLSLWYIRRSRNRFQNPRNAKERKEAISTLGYVLSQTSLLAAPFIPFLAEHIFEKVQGKESVHLKDWPKADRKKQKMQLEKHMEKTRSIASKALALRAKAGLRVRQPLASATIKERLEKPLLKLLVDELNVKKIVVSLKAKEDVKLDVNLTPALKEEGLLRELLRHIQGMRKDAGYKPGQLVWMRYAGDTFLTTLFQQHEVSFKKLGGLKELRQGDRPKQVFDVEKEVVLEGKKLWLGIRRT